MNYLMRFHSQYCSVCKKDTLFLEKLVDCKSITCTEIEDICQSCNNKFEPQKTKLKLCYEY